MKYFDLKKNTYVDVNESKSLKFLYNNIFGRILLKIVISKPIRYLYNKYMCTSLSCIKIKRFIKKNNINMQEYIPVQYKSYNDFFMRNIKTELRPINDGLIAVADSKLLVYKIDLNSSFKIKDSIYTIEELIHSRDTSYVGGYALIFRLAVDDYHHYVFPDDGKIEKTYNIAGIFNTVQPVAFKKYKVFHENSRTVTLLNCKNLGKVCYIEVGAMMIGKIVNKNVTNFNKGDEKGHFEFGGSTIILLFEKDKIKLNEKIVENSKNDIETIVKLGEKID